MKKHLIIITFMLIAFSCSTAQPYENVDAKTFSALIKKRDGVILDVRTEQEYLRGHIENSTLISTSDPKFVEKVSLLQKNKPLYIYCLSGSRSRAVANYLSQNGFTNVYNLTRGLLDWNQNGLALAKGTVNQTEHTKTYTANEFDALLSKNKLVLVDFYAPWCAPCKKMAPVVADIEKNFSGKALVKKLDVQANQKLQKSYNVEAIPGFVLFKNGEQVWKHIGMLEYSELANQIEKHL